MTHTTRNRITVFFIGFFLCLVCAELSLRLVGMVYSNQSEREQLQGGKTGDIILCLGDSVTFGLGAPQGFSYPNQLQQMLAEHHHEKKYTVINRGWPGQNSSQLLLRMEKYLQEFVPSTVILLTGARNQDNFFGFRSYLQQAGHSRGFILSLHDKLDSIRIYKFFRLLFKDITGRNSNRADSVIELPEIQPGKFPSEIRRGREEKASSKTKNTKSCFQSEKYKEMGQYDKALESVELVLQGGSAEIDCYYLAGSIYREQKRYRLAEEKYLAGIKQNPSFFGNYDGMGLLFFEQKRYQEALQWFYKGFKNAAYQSLYGHCYKGISDTFIAAGKPDEAVSFFENEIKRLSPADDYLEKLAEDYLLFFQRKNTISVVTDWIHSDLEQIILLLQRYNVKQIILQNYPNEPAIAHIYREVARDFDLILVDQHKAFAKYTDGVIPDPDYFVPDGHPNAQGYQLMAQGIEEAIISGKR